MIATRTQVQQFVPGDAKARSRWARMTAASQKFYFVRFRLLNSAVPVELQNISANATSKNCPLVIDSNANQYGKTGVGESAFAPKAIVIAGAQQRKAILDSGKFYATGWVGEKALKAMHIMASDGISSDEIRQKLSEALRVKFHQSGSSNNAVSYGDSSPWVNEFYPFENYMIFSLMGDKFRQDYTIDSMDRTVSLVGTPTKVAQEYMDVEGSGVGYDSFDAQSKAPYVPTGLRVHSTMVLPALFSVSLGANNSELRNPMFGEAFLNVDKVVAAYLANIRNGYYSPIIPYGTPVPGVRMTFAGELKARGVQSPADFFKWVETNKHLRLASASSDASDWAHTPDTSKPSTWKLPMHTKSATRNSISKFHESGVPEPAKPAAAKKLVSRAKSQGVPTDGLTLNTEVAAGGPGSGPRKGNGLDSKRQSAQKFANSHGKMADELESHPSTKDSAVRYRKASGHYAKAAQAYRKGDEKTGDAHMTKGTAAMKYHGDTVEAGTPRPKKQAHKKGGKKVKAGGPGSGPHPGGGGDPKLDVKSKSAQALADSHERWANVTQEESKGLSRFIKFDDSDSHGGLNSKQVSERHRTAAQHFRNAANAYKTGDEAAGDAHMAKGKAIRLDAAMQAGGPGSGRYPKGTGGGPTPGDGTTDEIDHGAYDTGKVNTAKRDEIVAELTKMGFKRNDAARVTMHGDGDDQPKFFVKEVKNGEHDTSQHGIMLNPDGSFEVSTYISRSGDNLGDVRGLKDIFNAASGNDVRRGEGVVALRRILNAATALQTRENGLVRAAEMSKATVAAKAMHNHLVAKGYTHVATLKSVEGAPARVYEHPEGHKAAVTTKGQFAISKSGQKKTQFGNTLESFQDSVK